MNKAFFDTNILVYAFDTSQPEKRKISTEILQKYIEKSRAVISTQILQEFYISITKKFGIPGPEAKGYAMRFLNLEVNVVNTDIILKAMDIQTISKISFWDGLIVASAEHARCNCLITEDLNDGQIISGVKVLNPFN